MVKSYDRFVLGSTFGVVTSNGSNALTWQQKYAIAPALNDVLVWNLRTGECIARWHDEENKAADVTCLAKPQTDGIDALRSDQSFAVGYSDGTVRMFSLAVREDTQAVQGSTSSAQVPITSPDVVFRGHRRPVTALAFSETGASASGDHSGHGGLSLLASGSQDTDIVVWDMLEERGLYRLRGHKDQINALRFIKSRKRTAHTEPSSENVHLFSASKDSLLKVWDLETQHCVETVVTHREGCFCMDVLPLQRTSETTDDHDGLVDHMLITGGGDGQAKVWKIDGSTLSKGILSGYRMPAGHSVKAVVPFYEKVSNIALQNNQAARIQRVEILRFTGTQDLGLVALQTSDKAVEILRIRNENDIIKKRKRRARRQSTVETLPADERAPPTILESITHHLIVRNTARIRSFDWFPTKSASIGKDVSLLLSLSTNALEVMKISLPRLKKEGPPDYSISASLELPAHRAEPRSVLFSTDGSIIASAASGSVKLWNRTTGVCIRTLNLPNEHLFPTSMAFLPDISKDGDYNASPSFLYSYLVVGTKTGALVLYDITSAAMVEIYEAHQATVWGVQLRPDRKVLVTGSGDKEVKFWSLGLKTIDKSDGNSRKAPVLALSHTRTLQMTDDVLAVCYSPDCRLIAVALLDSTVKIFFDDTLKFFLSLYGHKLPVLSMDISFDAKLIVTCSADKSIKLWGLDFGDCHKSLRAHGDSVMQVKFEPDSHLFWSVSKDKTLKYWDGDRFVSIMTLEGHSGEIWGLALGGPKGRFVATCSQDKSIRVWKKTDEPLFLEEERERELENQYEANVVEAAERQARNEVEQEEEVGPAGQSSSESLMAGERIIEAIDLAEEDRKTMREFSMRRERLQLQGLQNEAEDLVLPSRHPLILSSGREASAERYLLSVLEKIKAANLDDALLILPFGKVLALMYYLEFWASRAWNLQLTSKIIFYLLRTFQNQLTASQTHRAMLVGLQKTLRQSLEKQKQMIGFNMAALRYIQRSSDEQRLAQNFSDLDLSKSTNGLTNGANYPKKRALVRMT